MSILSSSNRNTVIEKRVLEERSRLTGILNRIRVYWIPKYSFTITNYTGCKVRVVFSSRQRVISSFLIGAGVTGGNVDVKIDNYNKVQEEILSNVNERSINKNNKCIFNFSNKICYISLYLISPSNFNENHNNIDKWVNIVTNKEIDLRQYKIYKILKSVEANCPNMPRPFI